MACALLASTGPAAAGGDPYGSTTTSTAAPGDTPDCGLSTASGVPGTRVTATVTNVPVGSVVRILFGGDEVSRATADEVTASAVGPAVVLGGRTLPVGVATTTVEIDFTVPTRPPGDYAVTAVGDTFSSPCGAGDGVGFEVLAAAAGNGGGGGNLPKTGIYAALLVAVALALLVGGRALLEGSRRRARAAERAKPRHSQVPSGR